MNARIIFGCLDQYAKLNLPINFSEVSILSRRDLGDGDRFQELAVERLYRLWFSLEPMMGITWWNVVDGCGAPGEPAVSGLFTRDMEPKLSYFALDGLINREWRTNTVCTADADALAAFRGFRGRYRLSWAGADGCEESLICHLK